MFRDWILSISRTPAAPHSLIHAGKSSVLFHRHLDIGAPHRLSSLLCSEGFRGRFLVWWLAYSTCYCGVFRTIERVKYVNGLGAKPKPISLPAACYRDMLHLNPLEQLHLALENSKEQLGCYCDQVAGTPCPQLRLVPEHSEAWTLLGVPMTWCQNLY